MNSKLWLAIALVVIGLLARLYQFGQIPSSLYWDEVAIGLDARSLAQTGKDLSGHSWLQPLFYSYGDYKAPVYIWLTALIGTVTDVTETVVRLPSFLAGIGLGGLLYLVTKQVESKKPLLALSVLVSFLLMPWSFHFSRIGMESFLSLFWVTLMVYLELKGMQQKRWWLVAGAAVFGVVGLYSYIAARVIVVGLYLGTFLVFGWGKVKQLVPGLVFGLVIIGLGIGILVSSPNYAASQDYRLSNDNLLKSTEHIERSIEAQGEARPLLSRLVYHRYWFWGQAYLTNYLTHFSPDFLLFTGDSNLRHHSGFGGKLLLVQGLFLVFGFAAAAYSFKKLDGLMILWILIAPAVAALVNEVPHASRAVYAIVPLSWFLGRGMVEMVAGLEKRRFGSWVACGLLAVLVGNFGVYLHDYFTHYPGRSHLAWLVPYKQASLFFQRDEAQEPVFMTDQWYQPGLYWAFYQDVPAATLQQTQGAYLKQLDRFTFGLPQACLAETLCVAPPDWQTETTQILSTIPGTEALVVKATK